MSLLKSRFIEMFGNVATNNKRWEKTKLGNKSVIGSSKRIFANEYTTEGIPFYRSKEIIELGMGEKPSVELYISKKRYQEIKEKFGIPIPGDILMTAVGTIGKFWIVPNSKPFYYKDGNLVYIRTKEFNPLFLKKLLEMLIEKYKVENANGSAYTALTIEKLKDLQIVLPPMTLQKQYEEFHIQIDKSKFLLQQILEKFELLKKSRFIEMFENKTYKKVEGRNLFKFSSGKFLPLAKRMTSGIPVYGGNGISWYTDETLVSFDTIVIGRVGAYCGNVMLVKGDKWITDNAIYISEFKTKDLKLEFLEKLMESYDFHSFSDSSSQPKITQRPLENQLYIVPPIELQEEYINQIKQIDKSKLIIQKALEDLVGKV